jgi:nucleoside-diphosphate-sugar epimerase
MVIGHGMLANTFHSYAKSQDILVFASGVSNSRETNVAAYAREETLLRESLKAHPYTLFIYFSSCSIYDSTLQNSPYVLHKIKMENIIQNKAQKWLILRLPQVVGPTNSPTLVNFLFQSILAHKEITIFKHATRNLIWHEDVFTIIHEIIKIPTMLNQIINIASLYNKSVSQIVEYIEQITSTQAKKSFINSGQSYNIDISAILDFVSTKQILSEDYSFQVLKLYWNIVNKGDIDLP